MSNGKTPPRKLVTGLHIVMGCVTAALVLPSLPAQAQGTDRHMSAVEEIIVTARRREENLQQVPIAITAMSAEDLELRNVENTKDLNVLLPNVDIRGFGTNGAARGSFAVRGIPGVARYFDGVVYSGNQGSLANVVEMERIEVLRGPQGTLFGKNAIGGAIQYISKRPAEEFGARIKATLGESNRRDIIANVDIPFGDTVRSKLTFASLQRDGFVKSTTIDENYGEENNQILRGVLEWAPSENFTGTVIVERNEIDQGMQANVLWDIYENIGTAMNYHNAFLAGNPNVPVDWTDANFSFGQREQYKTASDYKGLGTEITSTGVKMNLEWALNDSLSLRSITGERGLDYGNYDDFDASQYIQYERWYYEEVDELSQEFQLLGNGDRFKWVVGLYYYDEEQYSKLYNWQNMEIAPRLINTLSFNEQVDTAAFAEGTYDLTDSLSLTVGARYTNEEFSYDVLTPAEAIPAPRTISRSTAGTTRVISGIPIKGTVDFDHVSPRIVLQNQFTDNIMAYISWSEGFDGGGVNTRFNVALPNNGITPYDGQTLSNYELGVRTDLFDNRLRLNATYFDGTWEDIQVAEVLIPGTAVTTNAGEAVSDGFEIEGTYRATDNLTLNFTLGKLHTAYTDVGKATIIAKNTPFPFAPERSYSVGIQYDTEIGNGGAITSRLDYGWIDDFETFRDMRFQVSNQANNAYGLLSGRLQYTPAEGNWDLALIGTNLTNEYYRLGGFAAYLAGIDQGVVARPREIGLTLSVRL